MRKPDRAETEQDRPSMPLQPASQCNGSNRSGIHVFSGAPGERISSNLKSIPGRRFVVRLAALALVGLSASALTMTAQARDLALASDMQATGAQAEADRLPILLVVTQEHCPFCHKIKEEILRPMLISGEYEDKVLIRELLIDPGETLRDFQGRQRDAREFAHGYKVWVTPTLLYLGPDGRELRPRILGINTLEMYGYYVDQGIEESLQHLRSGQAKPYVPSEEDIGERPEAWDDSFF